MNYIFNSLIGGICSPNKKTSNYSILSNDIPLNTNSPLTPSLPQSTSSQPSTFYSSQLSSDETNRNYDTTITSESVLPPATSYSPLCVDDCNLIDSDGLGNAEENMPRFGLYDVFFAPGNFAKQRLGNIALTNICEKHQAEYIAAVKRSRKLPGGTNEPIFKSDVLRRIVSQFQEMHPNAKIWTKKKDGSEWIEITDDIDTIVSKVQYKLCRSKEAIDQVINKRKNVDIVSNSPSARKKKSLTNNDELQPEGATKKYELQPLIQVIADLQREKEPLIQVIADLQREKEMLRKKIESLEKYIEELTHTAEGKSTMNEKDAAYLVENSFSISSIVEESSNSEELAIPEQASEEQPVSEGSQLHG